MNQKLDCLIIRQPFASLIAYGSKRWEFRNYNSRKRGHICIASSKGPPLKTTSQELNLASKSFPRGFILATAILENSFCANSKTLSKVSIREKTIFLHKQKFKVTAEPFGEPINDILNSMNDADWQMFVWQMRNVTPLRKPIALQGNHVSTWTKVELPDSEVFSKNLLHYLSFR
jgi:hypothetical protein